MHVLHPDLKFNYPLDLHFLKQLESADLNLLDESDQLNYKNILIDQTRDLYTAKMDLDQEYQQNVMEAQETGVQNNLSPEEIKAEIDRIRQE
jgi:hypothetical protein